ncbi:alanine--glyoxylate aminotransferase 2, mitochondrial-like isoform X2 [Rhopilema esculentum]|uniref:alanine--glyoxylate aminotransferase 2, mitochondrial-like isoform X2 n=1 Tax=Rhopilema esculentum TaxID=499914 RepID=UPI0031E32874
MLSKRVSVSHVRRITTSRLCTQQHSTYKPPQDEDLQMPECDFQPQPYKGMSYEKALELRKKNLSPALLTYYKKPLHAHQGYMQWIFDADGKRYLDMFAGIVTVSIGHCHPRVNAALKSQVDRLWHTTNIYMNSQISLAGEKLASKMPGDLKVVYFVNSGSEANDLATLMARAYTRSFDIINLRNSYHGTSPSLLGILAQTNWKQNVPLNFGYSAAMNPDVYRGIWGGKNCRDSPVQTSRDCDCNPGQCKACDGYVGQLQEVLDYAVSSRIAAFFAEPIQGVGGTVQYPKGYLKQVYEKVRSRGGLCIADEVQTGFGRTGEHYWGFQGHDVIPDIVTMAKGIGNGFPMAAVVTTPEIARSITTGIHFNTFGGNPVASEVASTVMDVIDEEKLQENANNIGTSLLLKYAKLRDEFPIVGDVRGKGFMIGIEMVSDKETKTPLPAEEMADIWERTKNYGVLFGKGGRFGNVFRIKPPMCITQADADFSYAVLRKSIREHLEGL